jgi:thermitase
MNRKAKIPFFAGTVLFQASLLLALAAIGSLAGDDRGKRPPRERAPIEREFRKMTTAREAALGYVQDRVLVKFRPSISAMSVRPTLAAYGSVQIASIPAIGVVKARVPARASVEEFLSALRRNPDVEYAEPDYRTSIQATPNDEYFWRQYALANNGDNNGPPGSPQPKAQADIKATTAWESTKGSADVIIGILDTGVDLNHPDIKNKLVSAGHDFFNNDDSADDDNWHGTHVAGIAAAETDNSQGIAGVAWNCRVLPVKIVGADGTGSYSTMIDGLVWAADQGVEVINLSVGGDEPSDSLRAALKYAFDKGVVIAAAAGNDATHVVYPAAYDDYVLAVAATDAADAVADFSTAGPEVDVAAPGVDVLSLIPTWYFGPDVPPYAFASGTSMATPHVAGFAALIKSLKPWLTVQEVMNVIRYTADDVNSGTLSGRDDKIGYGRINMQRALGPYQLKAAASMGAR